MSKSIRSFPETQRSSIAHRRALALTGGIGFWGAIDGLAKHGDKSTVLDVLARFNPSDSIAQKEPKDD